MSNLEELVMRTEEDAIASQARITMEDSLELEEEEETEMRVHNNEDLAGKEEDMDKTEDDMDREKGPEVLHAASPPAQEDTTSDPGISLQDREEVEIVTSIAEEGPRRGEDLEEVGIREMKDEEPRGTKKDTEEEVLVEVGAEKENIEELVDRIRGDGTSLEEEEAKTGEEDQLVKDGEVNLQDQGRVLQQAEATQSLTVGDVHQEMQALIEVACREALHGM